MCELSGVVLFNYVINFQKILENFKKFSLKFFELCGLQFLG